jgi:hypothetical protein
MDVTDLKEFHVYIQVNQQGTYRYLGTTRSPDATFLEWKPTVTKTFNVQFRSGPQFGNVYRFMVYALTKTKKPLVYGPFQTQGPVEFKQSSARANSGNLK